MPTPPQTPKLPPLAALANEGQLADALSILFEPSPALLEKLVPAIHAQPLQRVESYETFIDLALSIISSWPKEDRASFISGHPRIGEVKNLSALSAAEQARTATPPEVLERLGRQNEEYETLYPRLRYITFVNGRSRAQVADEMEERLQRVRGDGQVDEREWEGELMRAVVDVGKIAKSRLSVLL
ncbi:hypothetical protein EXIGLDRAFT_727109 [Exidia glandulosa HHB12029]|uniref:Oxo-4-hydroxy-4-carboxy-5-ureidoimidazoline decarboxylase domain-containing protein n=1 Tax=Exidia glandulosa HHB12029 TaxID=1314781 RepID=A0A165M5F0_EXIGL|nr:hypothetical protein EXIGLDRAFT_727109 [Exidia glandulosa HHB12029]